MKLDKAMFSIEQMKVLIYRCKNGATDIELKVELNSHIIKIYADFSKQLEDAKAQGFREAIKEMGKVKGL